MEIKGCDNKNQMALLALILLGRSIKHIGFDAELAARIAVETISEAQSENFWKNIK